MRWIERSVRNVWLTPLVPRQEDLPLCAPLSPLRAAVHGLGTLQKTAVANATPVFVLLQADNKKPGRAGLGARRLLTYLGAMPVMS